MDVDSIRIGTQWNVLAKITAMTATPPAQVTDTEFWPARAAILDAYQRRGMPAAGRNLAGGFNQLQLTLFHAERLSTWKRPPPHQPVSVTGWSHVTPGIADTARRYLDQVTLSLRPNTVRHIEHDLRRFGTWLATNYSDVGNCTDLQREHIEAFKTWLSTTPTPRTGMPLNRVSIKNTLINLHCFFDRITEWGYPNAPVRPLVFIGDLPIIDKPLPRFLDDGAAAKLLRTARADADPLSRLIVELLARTGIRIGELLALTVDAVVQIGSAYVRAAATAWRWPADARRRRRRSRPTRPAHRLPAAPPRALLPGRRRCGCAAWRRWHGLVCPLPATGHAPWSA